MHPLKRAGRQKVHVIGKKANTKGSWNDELFTALGTQLVADYMVQLRAPVGVYLAAAAARC